MASRERPEPRPIVLLSGPVGAGKSAVARELVARSKGALALIEGDTFWSFLAKGEVDGGRTGDFRAIMAAMVAAAVPLAASGRETIVDFSIPPWFLDAARRIAGLRKVPLDYVVLRPSEGVCAARAAARTEGRIDEYSPYRPLYASFETPGLPAIEDDASDARTIATRIRAGLDLGAFRVPENLEGVENQGVAAGLALRGSLDEPIAIVDR